MGSARGVKGGGCKNRGVKQISGKSARGVKKVYFRGVKTGV